jgi:hypothetical protein
MVCSLADLRRSVRWRLLRIIGRGDFRTVLARHPPWIGRFSEARIVRREQEGCIIFGFTLAGRISRSSFGFTLVGRIGDCRFFLFAAYKNKKSGTNERHTEVCQRIFHGGNRLYNDATDLTRKNVRF